MSIMPEPLRTSIYPHEDEVLTSSEIVNKILALEKRRTMKQKQQSLDTITCRERLSGTRKLVENIYFQIFITLLTIISLFMEDARIIFIPKESDQEIDILNILFMAIFFTQILLSLSIEGYSCSFFFYLDLLSTLSIIMDISMFTDVLYMSNGSTSGAQLSSILKNSKASRVAARTVRIMKIFRLARIVKLYKSTVKAKQLKLKRSAELKSEKLKSMKLKKIQQAEKQMENNASYRNIQSQIGSKADIGSAEMNYGSILTKKLIQGVKAEKRKQLFGQQDKTDNIIVEGKKIKEEQRMEVNSVGKAKESKKNVGQEEQKGQNKSIKNAQKTNGSNKEIGTKQKEQQQQFLLKASSHQDSQEDSQLSETFSSSKQSKISKLLSENTMKKIIVLILLLMFSVPILDISNYYNETSAWDFMGQFISKSLENKEIPIQKINLLIQQNFDNMVTSEETNEQLLFFSTPFNEMYFYNSSALSNYRINDLTISQTILDVSKITQTRLNTLTLSNYNSQSEVNKSISIILSCRTFNQIDSWFSIGKILFICVIILYLLNTFNETISQLITQPIEKMLENVKNNGRSDSGGEFSQVSEMGTQRNLNISSNNYQTTNVHLALNKISTLISKIFTPKGKEQIYRKIFQKGSITENYLSTNKKVYSFVGLVTIENYHAISQILKSDVISLNNQIAEYLHSSVYRYGGNGVMNYQGSFLVIFELPNNMQHLLESQGTHLNKNSHLLHYQRSCKVFSGFEEKGRNNVVDTGDKIGKDFGGRELKKIENKKGEWQNNSYLNVFADFAVFSMVKTLVKINKQNKFFRYRKDTRLLHKIDENFQIKLSCTLHSGWIQQGFLGSTLKMDYCYFGETVNEVKKLAHSSNFLSNSVIVSETLYEFLTPSMKRHTRILGKCELRDRDNDQKLYWVDLNLGNISQSKSHGQVGQENKLSWTGEEGPVGLKKELNMEYLREQGLTGNNQGQPEYRASSFISMKKQLREVLKNVISQQFRRKYTLAYEYYLSRDYNQSKDIIEDLSTFTKEDKLVNRLSVLISAALRAAQSDSPRNDYEQDREEMGWLGL